jgi:hypothetical protein
MVPRRGIVGAARVLLPALGLVLFVCGPARPEIVSTGFREAPDSFTWELAWDGAAARPVTLRPERSGPEGADAPVFWSASLRSAAPGRGSTRLVFEARHACRVHDPDAPEGPLCRIAFAVSPTPAGSGDWSRLDRRRLDHLATPKDHQDTFDVFGRWETPADGKRVLRLVLQGAHGPAARAKKPAKGKKGAKGSGAAGAALLR